MSNHEPSTDEERKHAEYQPSLGPCQWFAMCWRDATHLEPHPAFPEGVPCCDRCAKIGRVDEGEADCAQQ